MCAVSRLLCVYNLNKLQNIDLLTLFPFFSHPTLFLWVSAHTWAGKPLQFHRLLFKACEVFMQTAS